MTVRKAAVLGSPIEHSRSPLLHEAAYRQLGLDWDYSKIELQADELEQFVSGLDDSWAGLSLTMPLKEESLRLATEASEVARATGSANTLVLRGGEWFADNTDVAGLRYAISSGRVVRSLPASVTILGTGATARSAVVAVSELNPAAHLKIAGRTPANVEKIVAWATDAVGVPASGQALGESDQSLLDSEIVISTIPIDAESPLVDVVPEAPGLLVEVVYDPPTNPLSEAWLAAGGKQVGGLTMLVGQAAEQVRLMTGYEGSLEPIREAMLAAVAAEGA